MADFSALKTAIQANIRTNGNEEITGAILQDILLSMVSTMGDGAINALTEALQVEITNRQNAVSGEATARAEADSELSGRINAEATARAEADTQLNNSITAITTRLNEGYVYAGIATPSTNPGTPAGKVFYIALQAGTYTNFSAIVVAKGISILKYGGTSWSLEQLYTVDDTPKKGSTSLINSGGVFANIGAFDISEYNKSGSTLATYADLTAALAALPSSYQKGGMSVKFVQSSDNKYVQYRLMADSWSTDVTKWQGVDNKPTPGSKNLVESGGVYDETHTENDVDKTSTAVGEHYIVTNVSVGSVVDIENPTEAGNFEYIIFQVLAGEKIKVKGQGGNAPRLWAFIDIDKKMIESSDNSLYLNDYVTLTAPANGYFISNSIMNSQDYPHSVKVESYISVKESIAQLDEKIEGIQENIINANNTIDEDEYRDNVLSSINSLRIGLRPKVMFYGYDEGGRWLNVGNASYRHRLFVLKSGDEIKIKAGTAGSHYSFLKDAVKPINLAAMNYVDGYTRTTIAANAEVTVNAPADCFLYVLIAYNNDTGYVPASLSVNGVEQLEVLENQDVREYFPDGVLKNDATNKRLTFYGRRKGTSQYFAFRIQHKIDHSELGYADLWHLTKGHLCNYSNGVFTDVCETIDDAENEMAIKFSDKADFTGGYHGDERIDIDSSSFVRFFVDGKLITDISTDFEVECASFDYVQFSTLHETTSDGTTPVTGHPIVAYHFKKSSFENGKFRVENSIKMASAQTVTTAFAGLFCTDKNVASVAIIPFAQEIQMSGNSSQYGATNKQDALVLFYDNTNKVECIVDGHFEQGYDDNTDVNYYIIWDRNVDSKYYRGNSLSKEFAQGDIIRNKFSAEFL